MGEQPTDAGGPSVTCLSVQGQPFPFGVGLVDCALVSRTSRIWRRLKGPGRPGVRRACLLGVSLGRRW